MRYIALLRGINVGGNTMLKMAELKATFESVGFANVVTYINSGNLAFDTRKTSEAALVEKVEKGIESRFGKHVPVMVREQDEINRILGNNPYEGDYESHKEMHVLFLKEEMPKEKIDQLLAAAPQRERFSVQGREIYCHLQMGVADSLLGKRYIEQKLEVVYTGRNWRTVEKLALL